jgi:hypothetical protein
MISTYSFTLSLSLLESKLQPAGRGSGGSATARSLISLLISAFSASMRF